MTRHTYTTQFQYLDAGILVEDVVIGECEHDGDCSYACDYPAITDAARKARALLPDGCVFRLGWTSSDPRLS